MDDIQTFILLILPCAISFVIQYFICIKSKKVFTKFVPLIIAFCLSISAIALYYSFDIFDVVGSIVAGIFLLLLIVLLISVFVGIGFGWLVFGIKKLIDKKKVKNIEDNLEHISVDEEINSNE